jgi:hypothetical protein
MLEKDIRLFEQTNHFNFSKNFNFQQKLEK